MGAGTWPGGRAGSGSQEQQLLNVACQPRGCACGGSGGDMGTQCALLSGKKFCHERRGELFPPRGAAAASLTPGMCCDWLPVEGKLLCSRKLSCHFASQSREVIGCKTKA